MDPFETLGLVPSFEVDTAELERRYRDLQRALHPDKHVDATATIRQQSLSKAVDVNEAYRILRDDLRRAEALLRHMGAEVDDSSKAPADPEFLMEVMELRESLSEARAESNMDAVVEVGAGAAKQERAVRDALAEDFTQLAAASSAPLLEAASAKLGRLRYYRRLRDEVAAIEDEALG
jgi:molecular chaperone HscB